jgi:hypothetical protein
LTTGNFLENSLKKCLKNLKPKKNHNFLKHPKMNAEESKRKFVIDLTKDDEITYSYPDGKRVVISNDEGEQCTDYSSDLEEEDGNCCGMCGSEYESREDTADVCLGCYECERNICHGCKEVFESCEFVDKEGEYCEGYCKECWPSMKDIIV